MAYDNSSLTGDEICDYYYDIENNFMNPPSPTGFFIYKVIGGAFDRLNDLVTQFRIDYSILDCNVGDVEIVNGFPEEPNAKHTYYVPQYTTAEGHVFTKYSHNDNPFVDVFSDECTSTYNKSSGYVLNTGSYSFDNGGLTIDATTFSSSNYQANLRLDDSNVYTVPFEVSFDLINDGNDNFRLYFHNTSFSNSAIASGSLWTSPSGQTTKVRFVVTEDGITRYINDTPSTLSLNQDVAEKVGVRFGYWQPTQSSMKIRNYKVTEFKDEWVSETVTGDVLNSLDLFWGKSYNLIRPHLSYTSDGDTYNRVLSDEEYRIYLYLKEHQLLTMKDLLVAFSNAFGSAETSTTILNSIHTVDHKRYDNPPFSNDSLKAYDDEDTDITTDKLVDKDGVNLINNRLAQGTTSILIPDEGWDEHFLRFLESFISIKGNILITTGG